MRVLCVDPGSQRSAFVLLEDGVPTHWGWEENMLMNESCDFAYRSYPHYADHLAIEYVYLRGMKVYQQAIDTVFWAGRFAEAWGSGFTLIDRKDVKMALCGNASANDSSIRLAIIDSFGGPDVAIGGKRCQACHGSGLRGRGKARGRCIDCHHATGPLPPIGEVIDLKGCGYEMHPGPLHAFAKDGSGGLGHRWAALAVGLTYIETLA